MSSIPEDDGITLDWDPAADAEFLAGPWPSDDPDFNAAAAGWAIDVLEQAMEPDETVREFYARRETVGRRARKAIEIYVELSDHDPAQLDVPFEQSFLP
jgi:hypothetical protein